MIEITTQDAIEILKDDKVFTPACEYSILKQGKALELAIHALEVITQEALHTKLTKEQRELLEKFIGWETVQEHSYFLCVPDEKINDFEKECWNKRPYNWEE